MVAHVRQVSGYAALQDKRPIAVTQLFAYAVLGKVTRFIMTADAKTMLRQLINSISSVNWTDSTLTIGTPIPASQTIGDADTEVVVSPKGGAPYIGTYSLFYRRVSFSRLFVDQVTATPLTPVSSLDNALSQINSRYGTFLTLNDVVPQTLSGQTSVTLTAADGSYLLAPGTQITIGA